MRRLLWGSVLLAVTTGILAFPVRAGANSEVGCEHAGNCVTVQVDQNGRLTSPAASGTVSLSGLTASTSYTAVEAIEALPAGTGFAIGSYTIAWGACTDGAAVGGTFAVATGGSYPQSPPATSPSPTAVTITSGPTGSFSCSYTLAYPSGTVPTGAVSVKSDFWAVDIDGTVATQVASGPVPPGGNPPVPEAPLAVLIPTGMLLVGAGHVLVRRRRAPAATS